MSAAFLLLLLLRVHPRRCVLLHLRLVLNRQLSMAAFPASVPRRTSTASSGWQCSPPDLNLKFRLAAFPAGPQPQVPLGSVPRRTSITSSGWQCSPPDLSREFCLAAFPAGPQPRVPLGSVPAGPQTPALSVDYCVFSVSVLLG